MSNKNIGTSKKEVSNYLVAYGLFRKNKMFLLFFLFFCFPKFTYSQNKNGLISRIGHFVNGYDSLYIGKVKEKYMIAPRYTGWFDSYSLTEDETGLFFQSDMKYNIGPYFGYKSIVLGYSINASDLFSGEKGKSRQWNFNLYSNRMSVEVSILNNSKSTNLVKYKDGDNVYELNQQFSGLESKNTSINLFYYLNYRKYSNSANYSNGHNFVQLRNAGSIILTGSYMYQKMDIDLSGLELENLQMSQEPFKVKSNIYYLGAGYGYNYLLSKKLLANVSVIPSLGLRYGTDNNKTLNGKLSYNTKAKMAINYSFKKYLLGFNAQHNGTFVFFDNYTYNSSLNIFNLIGCIRF